MAAKRINIMFTCIGRRVSLLNSFRQAAKDLKLKASIIGTDTTKLSSALELCDKKIIVKPVSDPGYIRQILKLVKDNSVDLLIPTVDLDLKVLAENKKKFEKIGCCVLISNPDVIDICQDKRKTFRFLAKAGFDTPDTLVLRSALAKRKMQYPCFLKPWDGHASRGTARVNDRKDLAFFGKRVPNCIVQEYVDGIEYTCDAYVDMNMKVRCVVPRMRIEVRSGEVSKAQVINDPKVIEQTAKVVQALGAGPGVITIQLIVNAQGNDKFIEINPRFGGGAPLSIKAGANFPKWILQELIGKKPRIVPSNIKDKLTMLRYDSEVWI